ncbi:MAG: ABC transporter substrate-binding protein [Lachnospiraceae bacterium]|nr:ABC transporter substrate-binding protein [Lachnospiraceae bacterium]MDY5741514.1 ABC transporter substrate-binding protein [Lachnospiraceae bacterium]
MKKAVAAFMAVALLMTGCVVSSGGKDSSKSGKASDKIVIGGLGPLTGKLAIYGVSSTNAMKLAFDEINKAGGIGGKQVEFKLYDDKGEAAEAVNNYKKLKDDGITALLGCITSAPSEAVAAEAVKDKTPMVTPTGTQFNITKDRENVFRVCFTDPFQGTMLAKYAADTVKAKKVAVMKNTSSDYSDGVAEAFKAEAKKRGLEVVAEESYGNEDTDFRAQLTNIAKENPDVLMIPDYYQINALIAPQAKEIGITARLLGPDGWDGIIAQFGDDKDKLKEVDGVVFTNHYSVADTNERIQTFVKNYKAQYKEEPSAFSALSYDSVYLLKEAIEKAGSTDKAAVAKAIKEMKFSGLTGDLSFDANNNPVKSVSMIKVSNGQYVLDSVLKPE